MSRDMGLDRILAAILDLCKLRGDPGHKNCTPAILGLPGP